MVVYIIRETTNPSVGLNNCNLPQISELNVDSCFNSLQKPLKRIEIEEVGLDDDTERQVAMSKTLSAQSETKKNIVQQDSTDFQRFTANSPADIASLAANSGAKSDSGASSLISEVNEIESVVNGQESTKPVPKTSDSKVCDKNSKTKATESSCTANKPFKKPVSENSNNSSKGGTSPRSVNSVQAKEFSVPTTSVQFQADYRRLKSDIEAFYQYFKVGEQQFMEKF